MDPNFNGGHDTNDFIKFEDEIVYPSFAEPPNLLNGENTLDVNFNGTPFSPPLSYHANFLPFSSMVSEVDSPNDSDSDPVFKYLNQILLEENMDERPSMFFDPLALQAAEKSLYDTLGKRSPASSHQQNQKPGSYDSLFGNSSEYSTSTSTSSVDPNGLFDPWGYYRPSIGQSDASDNASKSPRSNAECSTSSNSNFGNRNSKTDGLMHGNLFQNILNDSNSMWQFRKCTEEASKVLPGGYQLIIDVDKYNLPPKSNEISPNPDILLEKDESKDSFSGSRGRKPHRPESELEDQRSSKLFAGYVEEVELSEVFNKVLLFADAVVNPVCGNSNTQAVEADKSSKHNKVKSWLAVRKKRLRNHCYTVMA